MSREELVQKFGELIWLRLTLGQLNTPTTAEMDRKDADKIAISIAPEIERLLAAEREPMKCGHPKACLVPIEGTIGILYANPEPNEQCSVCIQLEAERERVREMCVGELERSAKDCFAIADGTDGDGREAWRRVAAQYQASANDIRQLDLTKDLAPSSTEEKENG